MKKLIFPLVLIAILISACASSRSPEITGAWNLVSYGNSSNPTPALPDVDASIEFKSGGTLSGNVGCNGFGGDYKVVDGTIEFGPIVSTLMFCEEIADQESTVLAVLNGSATFLLDGDTLMLTSLDGSSVVVLVRK